MTAHLNPASTSSGGTRIPSTVSNISLEFSETSKIAPPDWDPRYEESPPDLPQIPKEWLFSTDIYEPHQYRLIDNRQQAARHSSSESPNRSNELGRSLRSRLRSSISPKADRNRQKVRYEGADGLSSPQDRNSSPDQTNHSRLSTDRLHSSMGTIPESRMESTSSCGTSPSPAPTPPSSRLPFATLPRLTIAPSRKIRPMSWSATHSMRSTSRRTSMCHTQSSIRSGDPISSTESESRHSFGDRVHSLLSPKRTNFPRSSAAPRPSTSQGDDNTRDINRFGTIITRAPSPSLLRNKLSLNKSTPRPNRIESSSTSSSIDMNGRNASLTGHESQISTSNQNIKTSLPAITSNLTTTTTETIKPTRKNKNTLESSSTTFSSPQPPQPLILNFSFSHHHHLINHHNHLHNTNNLTINTSTTNTNITTKIPSQLDSPSTQSSSSLSNTSTSVISPPISVNTPTTSSSPFHHYPSLYTPPSSPFNHQANTLYSHPNQNMPFISHSRVPSFPFRRRRVSSSSSAPSDPITPSPTSIAPPIPPLPSHLTHLSSKSLTQSDDQQQHRHSTNQTSTSNTSQSTHEATLLPPKPAFQTRERRSSMDFAKLGAAMAKVRLRGRSHELNHQGSRNSSEQTSTNKSNSNRKISDPANNNLPWDNSRSSLHAETRLQPSPGPTPQIDLTLLSRENSTSDSSPDSSRAPSSRPTSRLPSPNPPALSSPPSESQPINHPHSRDIQHATGNESHLSTFIISHSSSSSQGHSSEADQAATLKLDQSNPNDLLHDSNSKRDEDALPSDPLSHSNLYPQSPLLQPASSSSSIASSEETPLAVRIQYISTSPPRTPPIITQCPISFSRTSPPAASPTLCHSSKPPSSPSPSNQLRESTSSASLPVVTLPPPRRPLPSRLRTLPRLDSYCLSPATLIPGVRQLSNISDSSADPESSSADHESGDDAPAATPDPEEDDDETDDDEDTFDDEEHPNPAADQTITMPMSSFPVPTSADTLPVRLQDWVTFDGRSPPTTSLFARSVGNAITSPNSSNQIPSPSSYFDVRPISPLAMSLPTQTPGDRARMILMSPSLASIVQSPVSQHDSRRPSLASRRSQSVLDFQALAIPPPASILSLSSSITTTQLPTSTTVRALLTVESRRPSVSRVSIASPQLPSSSSVVDAPLPPSKSGSGLAPSTSSPSLRRVARRQSMYEMRPSTLDPPPYQQIYQTPGGVQQVILPREEEGREGLPNYTCLVHLEGWMPRKMEFRSPGIQAKDRAWKRQYVILHGTMIRIYKTDPHAQPVSGEGDVYLSAPRHEPISTPSNPLPLHFHKGRYESAPSGSLKEAALAKVPTQHNSLLRVYTLQNAESGLAADYLKRKNVVRVRAEGEQFLLQARDDRGVIDLIEALQAATNVSLDLDVRPLPKFITLPRRRRRRRQTTNTTQRTSTSQQGTRSRRAAASLGAEIVDAMIHEANSAGASGSTRHSSRWSSGPPQQDRMADMLAEEQYHFEDRSGQWEGPES
ncbi:uncharacterized protein MELLADRAFT_111464 [Melampsora larici-populina 98AG31]|uniref:PH domain-containing protein n=1 Tax=Melampsora larici-populina (strain 98AG31 / pathotype 3-4-7) TaxID=747676 RepID=F4S398_MELLP|nr:uncharacterized protein MELLADRAFT_111464 [Melampsora larici-populina 98AG31]EGG00949.1 hypothetical protein MELLADRAFT_111464 [Melampsora larici-populina 98AG31]